MPDWSRRFLLIAGQPRPVRNSPALSAVFFATVFATVFTLVFVATVRPGLAKARRQQVVLHDPRAALSAPARDAALARIEAALVAADLEDATFAVGMGTADIVTFVKGDGGLDRRYHADSAQKWILATLLLRDARARGVTLDQPLSSWPKVPRWASGEVGQTTLRQLLSFTSGFDDPPLCAKVPSGRFAACIPKLVSSKRTLPRRYFYGTHHMLIALAALTGDEPNPSAALLERFRQQTGLLATASHRGDKPLALDVTPREYVHFLGALARHQLLAADDEREMFSDQVKELGIAASPADRAAKRDDGLEGRWRYGLGNWLRCDEGKPCSPHHHSAGARGFYPFIDVDTGLYGLVAHNARVGDWAEGHRLYQRVRADLLLVTR